MTAADPPSTSQLLRRVIDLLNTAELPYCILHGYVGFPDQVVSDVDCIVGARLLPTGLPRLLLAHRDALGARVVQWLQHEATAHYFVLATDDLDAPVRFLAFDASSDYRARGRRFYAGVDILARRERYREFWVPPAALEFGYYLVKRIGKGALETAHQRRLSELFAADPPGCRREIARFWVDRDAEVIARAAASSNWEAVTRSLIELRRHLLAPNTVVGWWNRLEFRARDLVRRIRRWSHPTGVFVVLLGPDGAGKSSVAQRLRAGLAPAFRRTAAGHFSPDLLGRAAARGPAGSTAPHDQSRRPATASVLKACYWLFEFGVGYWVRVRPALVRSTLVVYDRYLPDALVDPRRYRFGGPAWLLHAVWRIVPKPDLVVLLDASPDVLRGRKVEVAAEETVRQRAAYRDLVAGLGSGRLVDAARPLEEVVDQVQRIVLDHMAERFAERLGLAP